MDIIKNNRKEKIADWLELTVKILMLAVGFLQACNITYGNIIISFFLWPCIALGALLVLYRLLHFKDYLRTKGIFIMIAFCLSYVISMALNFKYGYYENFTTLVWIALQFFVLYLCDKNKSAEYYGKQIRILSYIYLSLIALMSIGSFIQMFTGYIKVTPQEIGPTIVEGFVWNRLFGTYWDPNIGAVMASVAIMFSLHYFLKNKKTSLKILFGFSAVLQFLYIVFSDSRTGLVCIISGTVAFTFTRIIRAGFIKRIAARWKQIAAAACIAVIAASVVAVAPTGIAKVYNVSLDLIRGEDYTPDIDYPSMDSLGRETFGEDITNRRLSIWQSGFEIFKTTPLFGTSHQNITDYAFDKLPETYLVNNDYMVFYSMHNLYVDLLTGQGIFGLAIFLSLAVCIAVHILKNTKKIKDEDHDFFMLNLSVAVTAISATVAITELIFVSSPTSAMFWLALGYMSHYITKRKENNNA